MPRSAGTFETVPRASLSAPLKRAQPRRLCGGDLPRCGVLTGSRGALRRVVVAARLLGRRHLIIGTSANSMVF